MVYDGENIALTFDESGTPTHHYLHDPAIDQVLAEETASGEVLWALADNQGTVRDLVDSDSNIQNHLSYDSFGNITNQTHPEVNFRFGYTGREWDAETGQYFYRARYYDSAVGRFLSEDPIGFEARDTNLYRYVGNSPTNYTDPSGEVAWIPLLAGAVALPILGDMLFPDPVQAPTHPCDIDPTDNAWKRALFEIGAGGAIGAGNGLLKGIGSAGDDLLRACFIAGTMVASPEGDRAIEDLVVGDIVISSDPTSGEVANYKVKHAFNREVHVVIDIQLGSTTITCSPEHPFWVLSQGWQEAGKLKPGTLLASKDGQALCVESVVSRQGLFTVYNIEVEGFHTYFVSPLSILVHNKTMPKGPSSLNQMADELSSKIGKNSVNFETPKFKGHIDLKGKAHFDKVSKTKIPTPHVQTRPKNIGPEGKINLGPETIRPATKADIRMARELFKRRGQLSN